MFLVTVHEELLTVSVHHAVVVRYSSLEPTTDFRLQLGWTKVPKLSSLFVKPFFLHAKSRTGNPHKNEDDEDDDRNRITNYITENL
jgi:hypothetical protein